MAFGDGAPPSAHATTLSRQSLVIRFYHRNDPPPARFYSASGRPGLIWFFVCRVWRHEISAKEAETASEQSQGGV